jgi:hypothetical protein
LDMACLLNSPLFLVDIGRVAGYILRRRIPVMIEDSGAHGC